VCLCVCVCACACACVCVCLEPVVQIGLEPGKGGIVDSKCVL